MNNETHLKIGQAITVLFFTTLMILVIIYGDMKG